MYKIGLSSCNKVLNDELFHQYSISGINAIEISPAQYEYQDLDYNMIKESANNHGIELWSYHLQFSPFEDVEISTIDAGLRKKTVNYYEELIKKGSSIGINKFIIHPSGEPIDDEQRPERIKNSKESLNILAEIASKEGSIIAVENLPRTCLGKNSSEILDLISENDKLMVCFDTNHLLCEKISDFINNVGKKIITLHVSDYDFIDERHWLPGEGKIAWNEVYDLLKKVGYNGVWMYELGFEATNIDRAKKLCCKDFVNNANKIFNHQI